MIKRCLSLSVQLFCAGTFIFLFFFTCSHAQGPGMPGDPGYDPDKEVPIDGGVGLLLAAGLAYGIKRIKDGKSGGRSH